MTLVVYEKSTCTACRKLATLLREEGVDVERVAYHVTGLTEDELRGLLTKMGEGPRHVLRTREPEAAAVKDLDDDALIAAMVLNPRLVQRPIVVRGDRAVLARPVERVRELLAG